MNFENTQPDNKITTISYIETEKTIKLCINNETIISTNYDYEIFDNYQNKNIKEINIDAENYFKKQLAELKKIQQYLFKYINHVKKESEDDEDNEDNDNNEFEKLSDSFDNMHEHFFDIIKNKNVHYSDDINFNLKINKLYSTNYLFEINIDEFNTKFGNTKTIVKNLKKFKFNYDTDEGIRNNILNIIKFYYKFIEKMIIDKIDNFIIYVVDDILNNLEFKHMQNNIINMKQNLDNCSNIVDEFDDVVFSEQIEYLTEPCDDLAKYCKNICELQNKFKCVNTIKKELNLLGVTNLMTTISVVNELKICKSMTNHIVNEDIIIDNYYYYIMIIHKIVFKCNEINVSINKLKINKPNYAEQINNIMNAFKLVFNLFMQ